MAAITIRNLDDELKARLRVRAAGHGRSMEEEVRTILRDSVASDDSQIGLGTRIRELFASVGGVDIPQPERREFPRHPEVR
jgi:plasmid stability protein